MNLRKVKLLKDEPTHYELHDGAAPFKIAKSGLTKEQHAKIKGFADGGKVGNGPPIDQQAASNAASRNAYRMTAAKGQPIKFEPEATPQEQGTFAGSAISPLQRAQLIAANPRVFGSDAAEMNRQLAANLLRQQAQAQQVAASRPAPQSRPAIPVAPPRAPPPSVSVTPGPVTMMADGGSVPDAISTPLNAIGSSQQWPASGQSPMSGAGSETPVSPEAAAWAARPASAPQGAPPPIQFTPGQPSPANAAPASGVSSAQSPVVSPELGAITSNIRKQGDIEKSVSDQQAEIAKHRLENEADFNAHQAGMNQAYQQARDAHMQKFSQAVQKYSDTNIDPNQLWANMGTGGKIITAIGLGLGAFGEGGVNRSVGIINQAIDRNIDAQKANLGKMKNTADMQGQLLGVMRGNFEDDASALAATKASMLTYAANQADLVAAKAKGQLQQLAAQQQASMLRMQAQAQSKAAAMDAEVKGSEAAKNWGEARKSNMAALSSPAAQQQTSDDAIRQAVQSWANAYSSNPTSKETDRAAESLSQLGLSVAGGRYNAENAKRYRAENLEGLIQAPRMAVSPEYRSSVVNQLVDGLKRTRDAKLRSGTAFNDLTDNG